MLRITKAEEQALRLCLRLAAEGSQRTLAELASRENLPEPTVAKLLGQLRRGAVVAAVRGRNGGYELAGAPEEISVAQVLWALGGDPAPPHPCVSRPQSAADCPRLSDCGIRSVWRHLQERVSRLLEGTSLADLLETERRVSEHVNHIWPREAAADRDGPGTVAGGRRAEGA
jgi:Rrf2 family iron-sulfur cluster assembly transcriptional regulator